MISNHLKSRRAKKHLQSIMGKDWKCASCETIHHSLFDLAAFAPDYWQGEESYSSNSEIRLDGDFLSEDFCIIGGKHFFVRCVFEFPVTGLDYVFGFGVWSTLSKMNFKKYIAGFDSGEFETDPMWTGWFSNEIKGIENTIGKECWVTPQPNRQRPLLDLMDSEHPASIMQLNGMSPANLIEIYAANGHTLRSI